MTQKPDPSDNHLADVAENILWKPDKKVELTSVILPGTNPQVQQLLLATYPGDTVEHISGAQYTVGIDEYGYPYIAEVGTISRFFPGLEGRSQLMKLLRENQPMA